MTPVAARACPEDLGAEPVAGKPGVLGERQGFVEEADRGLDARELHTAGAEPVQDLRSIDVLTPRATLDLVGRFVAPSQGVTWVLADPDPLLAATAPAANVANLRWITAEAPLAAADLPAAVRAMTTSRRLQRLFGDLEGLATETRSLGGGLNQFSRRHGL